LPTWAAAPLNDSYGGHWDSLRALALTKQAGALEHVHTLADRYRIAAQPIEREKLVQRLTALGMTMAPNRPQAEASVWIHETARLLRDLAEDVVCDAIDAHQLESKFLPTVAEIRERADGPMQRRRALASRLDAMSRRLSSGDPIPDLPKSEPPKPREPEKPMTAAEAEEFNRIMAKVGALTRYRPDGKRYEVDTTQQRAAARGPRRKPTRQDYIDLGVDPATLGEIA
jgi:hypothetical protein